MAQEANFDVADRDTVLDTMFAQHASAMIMAIADNGLFTTVPAAVPLTDQVVIKGAPSAVELLIPEDRVAVIEAWERLLAEGLANALVHPNATPNETVRLHFVDARYRYGVVLGFVTDFTGPLVHVAELEGRRTLDLLHPDDHQRAIESWTDMLANPGATRRVRLRHRHRDGHYLWLEITNHNQLNNPRHMCVVADMLNISEEMAAQEALAASELLLRRLTEALPVGVVQVDPELRITYQNERSVEMFGERLGRLGGDEFLIVAGNVAGPVQARQIGEHIAAHLAGCGLDLGGRRVPGTGQHRRGLGPAGRAGRRRARRPRRRGHVPGEAAAERTFEAGGEPGRRRGVTCGTRCADARDR